MFISQKRNERRKTLVQTIDIAPTILEFFNIKRPKTMEGKVLKGTIESDIKVRSAALFGYHGGNVNVTDGKYVYMRAPAKPENKPLYEYTHMPTHMRNFFSINELRTIELADPFEFTKNCKTMKINPINSSTRFSYLYGSLLFDLQSDPAQENPIDDGEIEKEMIKHLIDLMKKNDAPIEQYERLNIPFEGNINKDHLSLGEIRDGITETIGETEIVWKNKGKSTYALIISFALKALKKSLIEAFEKKIKDEKLTEIDEEFVFKFMNKLWPKQFRFYIDFMKVLIKEKAL